MNIDPKELQLNEKEFEVLHEILGDAQKRSALFILLETELLQLDIEESDKSAIASIQAMVKHV
jgi:hypothetical protein